MPGSKTLNKMPRQAAVVEPEVTLTAAILTPEPAARMDLEITVEAIVSFARSPVSAPAVGRGRTEDANCAKLSVAVGGPQSQFRGQSPTKR